MDNATFTRILYMEDDPGLARLLQKSLERKGYQVDIASNGEEGLRMLDVSTYDLLLLDNNMPILGGLDVLRRLVQKGEFPATIMVTGQGNEEVAVEAFKLGALDYIVKDVDMKYLELLPMIIDQVTIQKLFAFERANMQQIILENEERYRKLVNLSPDGIMVCSEGIIDFINPSGTRLLGATSRSTLIGRPVTDFVPADVQCVAVERGPYMEGEGSDIPWLAESFVRIDGTRLDVEFAAVAFPLNQKKSVQMIFRDISERKQLEEKLLRLALYDTLTGLPNRALFFDRLTQHLALAKRNRQVLALLYMDLDGFKTINDALGHEMGDLLLSEVGKRLMACVRKCDTVARIGGDEFICICSNITNRADAAIVAEKIVKTLSEPYSIKEHPCRIGISIGICFYPQDAEDMVEMIKNADTAMYRAKEQRTRYQFYTPIVP